MVHNVLQPLQDGTVSAVRYLLLIELEANNCRWINGMPLICGKTSNLQGEG